VAEQKPDVCRKKKLSVSFKGETSFLVGDASDWSSLGCYFSWARTATCSAAEGPPGICLHISVPPHAAHPLSLVPDSGDCIHPNKCWKGSMAGHPEFWRFLKSEEDNIYNPDS